MEVSICIGAWQRTEPHRREPVIRTYERTVFIEDVAALAHLLVDVDRLINSANEMSEAK